MQNLSKKKNNASPFKNPCQPSDKPPRVDGKESQQFLLKTAALHTPKAIWAYSPGSCPTAPEALEPGPFVPAILGPNALVGTDKQTHNNNKELIFIQRRIL